MIKSLKNYSPVHIWKKFFIKSNPNYLHFSSDGRTNNPPMVPLFVLDTKIIDYLSYKYGARFYKIKVKIPFSYPGIALCSNQEFVFDSFNFDNFLRSVNPRLDVRDWQKAIKSNIYVHLLGNREKGGLNCLELAEFFYFNIKSINVQYWQKSQTKDYESFDIEILLAVRSIVGVDLGRYFDENIFGLGWVDPSFITPLNVQEAKMFLTELGNFLPDFYKGNNGGLETAREYLHGWHWFRNYSNGLVPDDWKQISEPYYSNFIKSVEDRDSDFLGCENSRPSNPFVYSSYFVDLLTDSSDSETIYENDNILNRYVYRLQPSNSSLYHSHSEILGLSVESTYDSPAVLLNLFKSYCILKKIYYIKGTLYSLHNNIFYKHIGSLDWFKFNISLIMRELAEEFPISFSVIDQPLLLSNQLNKVMQLIEIDPNLLFKG